MSMERMPQTLRVNTRRVRDRARPRLIPRGVPPALADYPVDATDDPRLVQDILSGLLGDCRISVDGPPAEFDATINGIQLRGLTMFHLDIRGAATIEVPTTSDSVGVHMHTWNQSTCMVGATRANATPITALVSSPRSHLRISFDADGGSQLVVRIERDHVERSVSRMIGRRLDEPIVFDPVLDLASPRAIRWNIAMQLLSSEILTPESLLRRGAGQMELEDLLVTSLVFLQPSNYSDRLVMYGARKGVVPNATDWIEEHLAERISTASVAAAVHIGPRALQQAFQEALGQTPMQYIRDLRLERVHGELTGASLADALTVTAVAERWGFNHLGEFAAAYRRRYGQSPSQTLRGTAAG
jgi:AraC-like DNA-binding protein